MYKKILFLCLFLFFIGNVFAGTILEDFEDGDYTNDPTWTVSTGSLTIINSTTMQGDYYVTGTGNGLSYTTFDENDILDFNYMIRTNDISSTSYIQLLNNSNNAIIEVGIVSSKFVYNENGVGLVDFLGTNNPGNNTNYTGRIVYRKATAKADYYFYDSSGVLLVSKTNSSPRLTSGEAGVKIGLKAASTMGFDYVTTSPGTSVTADFNYNIDYDLETINLLDNSIVTGSLVITDWNWLKDGNVLATTQNTDFNIAPNTDYNICLIIDTNNVLYNDSICKTIETGGSLQLNFYDDTTETGLDEVYLEFDSTPYYSDTNTFIIIGLEDITNESKNLLMQVTGYQEKDFNLNFNKFTDYNYLIGFISSSSLSDVAFQVFTLTGATKPNTTFIGYDNDNNYLIDVKTTDSLGRMNFYLNNTKSDYNFISTDLNFGTTTWTIKKPKDATTLIDIVGNWKYSITGNSYSSGASIANDITKILLQNTVNPYYIRIQDVNEDYAPSNFGLQSVTSETTKILNPYLYPFGSANLVLIKLLDFSTNQPISSFNELQLSLYTDSNGLLEIGTYINDSTGTYNIYMDQNAKYRLNINNQIFILNPTLNIYYLYLTQASGLESTNDVNTITNDFLDLNSPVIFLEVREYFFGCSAEEETCYPSMIFSLIAIVVLAIGFSVYLTVGSLEQSILIFVLLAMFTFIGFIPIWLFAISSVVAFMWGVFS